METKRENHQKGKNKSLRDSTIPTNRYMIKNRSIQINFSRNPNNLCYTFRFVNLSLTSQTRNIYYVFLMDCSGVTVPLSDNALIFFSHVAALTYGLHRPCTGLFVLYKDNPCCLPSLQQNTFSWFNYKKKRDLL